MTEEPISPFGWDYINDLSSLPEDKKSIVEFLLHRVERGEVYTWVGPILLAANPGTDILKDLFDKSHQERYSKDIEQVLQNATPHVYAIANRVRYRLVQNIRKASQVIVISGESGTGKTFNARKILDFLASIDKNLLRREKASNLTHKIGDVCPLISAFSTARTEKNSKSSRHGQLVKLQYKYGTIQGACVDSFLLERTRVTRESDTFEIFYQIMAGLPEETLNDLGLSWGKNYTLLGPDYSNGNKQSFIDGFSETLQAMKTLNFAQECIDEIFQVLAILIHMGNVKFVEKRSDVCTIDTDDEESRKALEKICALTALKGDEFLELLTSTLICPKSMRRRHTMYRRDLRTPEDCRHRLFSIIRCLYDRLFHWLVDRINDTLSIKEREYNWLGILDIFGFESFQKNGLEQLCINYSTERLQLYFMENYLDNGQRELKEEGLNVIPPPPTMNIYRNRLSAIEMHFFTTMNDACQAPVVPDLSTMRNQLLLRKTSEFLNAKKEVFIINHYSCPVEYSVFDMLEKNSDKVPTELSLTFDRSRNSLLKMLGNISEEKLDEQGRITVKKCTTLSKLKSSMDSLMKDLNLCDAHYIRCVKPEKSNGEWLRDEFQNQLVCSGILDALPLARCRFPIRLTYEEFSKRYSKDSENDTNFKDRCQSILREVKGVDNFKALIHMGKRLIFLTESLFFDLECYRKAHRFVSAEKMKSPEQKDKSENSGFNAEKNQKIVGGRETEIFLESRIGVIKPSVSSMGDDDVFLTPEPYRPKNANSRNQTPPEIQLNDSLLDENTDLISTRSDLQEQQAEVESDNHPSVRFNLRTTGWRPKDLFVRKWIEHISLQSDIDSEENQNLNFPGWRSKDLLVRKWIEHISPQSDIDSKENQYSNLRREKFGESPNDPNRVHFYKPSKFSHENCQLIFKEAQEVEWGNDGMSCMIKLKNGKLFYKNRILSRHRISEVPIRFHTKRTCLTDSWCLPRSELPGGLQDCL